MKRRSIIAAAVAAVIAPVAVAAVPKRRGRITDTILSWDRDRRRNVQLDLRYGGQSGYAPPQPSENPCREIDVGDFNPDRAYTNVWVGPNPMLELNPGLQSWSMAFPNFTVKAEQADRFSRLMGPGEKYSLVSNVKNGAITHFINNVEVPFHPENDALFALAYQIGHADYWGKSFP